MSDGTAARSRPWTKLAEPRREPGGISVVAFAVGRLRLAVDWSEVTSIRRAHERRGTTELRVVSLSELLAFSRDRSVDDRVLVVDHEGEPLGLQVTRIDGLRRVHGVALRPLPRLVARNCSSGSVLGLLDLSDGPELEGAPAVALDVSELLRERADALRQG